MNSPLLEVTMAILYQEGKFLMQLRDDFPHIVHPGCWGFFGGHNEPGETPDVSIRRELLEEIGYVPPAIAFFQKQADNQKIRYLYHGELVVPLSELQLNEGQDMALCAVDEIEAGQKYSERLGEMRSLGKPHQQALLKFIDSGQSDR
ncbi:MAG: NUDIX hydrolase [Phormidesmis sp.]